MHWLKYIGRLVLYFLALCTIGRIVFLLVNGISLSRLFELFFHGLALDLSAIAYIALLPILFAPFLKRRWVYVSLRIYFILVFFVTSAVCIADGFFYYYWGLKSNLLFLEYTTDGFVGVASVQTVHLVLGIALFALLNLIFWKYALPKLVKKDHYQMQYWILLIPLTVIFARGSLKSSPINISAAYYSSDITLNNASVNPLWNLVQHGMEMNKIEGLDLLDATEEEILFQQFRSISSEPLFSVDYNDSTRIILVILESFSSKVSAHFSDSFLNISPNLDALAKQGISFRNAYASSFRSDRALTAVFKGIPTLARQNLTHYPNLLEKQSDLFQYFRSKDWNTSFHYGGDPNFANIAFLFNNSDSTFFYMDSTSAPQGVWGAHDEYVFERFAEAMHAEQAPSFNVLYSLSSHEPYDIKGYHKYKDPFMNSIAYTDSCLGVLLDRLKNDGKWGNTVVMITADHGTTSPEHSAAILPQNYRVPLCIIGGTIKDTLVIDQVVSQLDIPTTLINEPEAMSEWKFSHTLNAPSGIAFYTYYNGLVYIKEDSLNYYDLPQKKYLQKDMDQAFEKAIYQRAVKTFFEF